MAKLAPPWFLGPPPELVSGLLWTHFDLNRSRLQGIFRWRQLLESLVRSAIIVVDSPGLDLLSCILKNFEPVKVQGFIAERSVEGFYETVVSEFSWATEIYLYAMVIRPKIQQSTREFAAVVHEHSDRRPALSDQLVAGIDDIFGSQPLADANAQSFPREDIDDRRAAGESIGRAILALMWSAANSCLKTRSLPANRSRRSMKASP